MARKVDLSRYRYASKKVHYREILDWYGERDDWKEPDGYVIPSGSLCRYTRPPDDGNLYRLPHQHILEGFDETYILKARQNGGTRMMIYYLMGKIRAGKPGDLGFCAAQNFTNAVQLYIDGVHGFNVLFPDEWESITRTSPAILKHVNGVEVHVKSGAPDGWRGDSYKWGAIDELREWNERELQAATGTVSGGGEIIYATTPYIGNPVVEDMLEKAYANERAQVITFDFWNNPYLTDSYRLGMIHKWGIDTIFGKQEFWGDLTVDGGTPLFPRQYRKVSSVSGLEEVCVGVDPSQKASSAGLTGIVAGGVKGEDYYALKARQIRGGWDEWIPAAMNLARELRAQYGCPVSIELEGNNANGAAGAFQLIDPTIPAREVYAKESKNARAGQLAGAYSRGNVYHLDDNSLEELEREMRVFPKFLPGASHADLVDSWVHCFNRLSRPRHIGFHWL